MAENERIAVLETKMDGVDDTLKEVVEKIDKLSNMQITIDAISRQMRDLSDTVHSEQFKLNQEWVTDARIKTKKSKDSIREAAIRWGVTGMLTGAAYAAWYWVKMKLGH